MTAKSSPDQLEQRDSTVSIEAFDPVWEKVRGEALSAAAREPTFSGFFHATILDQRSLECAVAERLAQRLGGSSITGTMIRRAFADAVADDPSISSAIRADIVAIYDRDPACARFIEPILYFKGFHAIQTHRLAHWLQKHDRRDFALYLQSRSSEVFQCDINPAARIGKGIFLDHATGFVMGETAVVEDDVSILHSVTLGGTGKEMEDRHPKIRCGVLIGAGAKVLGNIEVGQCSRIASGSVVLHPVPPKSTVAGVPAKVVGKAGCSEPSRTMDQLLSGELYTTDKNDE